MRRLIAAAAVAVALAGTAFAQDFRQPAPAGAKVYFIEPKDGAEITGPVTVKFGLAGMGIAPAGVEKKDTGHHHLLINQKLADNMAAIPTDDKHRHFGLGQTETSVTLPAGKHTLQLYLADHQHIPHNPAVTSEVITITVK
jgi:opacity protein-like surface antigen